MSFKWQKKKKNRKCRGFVFLTVRKKEKKEEKKGKSERKLKVCVKGKPLRSNGLV
jgi:hypothetical protein